MTKVLGITHGGRPWPKTNDNVGSRRFLVIESDKFSKDVQATVLNHLKTTLPLALVVDSGGKSLHGWFYVQGLAEERVITWLSGAFRLGGDEAAVIPSQFFRMPGGTRPDGKPQLILYFDPSAILEKSK